MITGPGDDILDSIEAGTADDALMSKFKINSDQLKAFKSLHYGLSSQQMNYNEIGKYYPDVESYFKDDPVPKTSKEPGKNAEPPQDVFTLTKKRAELSKELNASQKLSKSTSTYVAPSVLDTDENTLNKRKSDIAAIDQDLKDRGYDPNELLQTFSDLPNISGIDVDKVLQLKKDNPQQYNRYKAAVKSQYGLLHAVEKKDGIKAANTYLQDYQKLQKAPDYLSQRQATKDIIAGVHKYIDNTEDQNKIIKDLVIDKSYGYGIGLPGHEEAINNDPRSQNLNQYQVTALQFLEDVDPATAQSFNRLLAFTPEEVGQLESNSSFARGYEAKARDLENIGMNLMRNSLEEKLNSMLKTKDSWTDEDKQKYAQTYERYNTLSDDYKNQNKRYPAVATLDADQQMQDAMGVSTKGVAEKTVLGIGENVDDAINWLGSLIQTPFQNDKESALDDLQRMGDKRLSKLAQHETEGQELFNREFKTVFNGELKKEIDDIKSNAALSDDEKRSAITNAILKDNRENVTFVPNDKAGKTNFTAKSVLNAVSNVASELAPQIALTYLTGGGANASKAKELTSLFGSTFAIAYNDLYNDAIEKNLPNPSQYALVHTTIEAATELLYSDVSRLKKLFNGKLAGKVIGELSEKEMSLLTKTGRFAKLKMVLGATAKSALKSSAQETFEEIVGQVAGNIADKKLFNQEVNVTDDVLKTGVNTFIGMLPLGALGLPFRYKEISQMQKYATYEAAMNPDKYLMQVEEDIKNNVITKSEGEARKEFINKAAKIAQTMNAVTTDGNAMSDNEKTELLTNEIVADAVQEQKKNATETTKEKLDKVEEKLIEEKEKIIKPKKNSKQAKPQTETQTETERPGLGMEVGAEELSPQESNVSKTEVVDIPVDDIQQNEVAEQQKLPLQNDQAVDQGVLTEAPENAEDVQINTEEDFERELNKIMQNKAPRFDEVSPTEINNKTSENSFEDYYKKAQAVLQNLLPDLNIKVYESENEYYEKEQRPKGSLGNFDPTTNTIAFNLQSINRVGKQRNVFHEIIHPIVDMALGKNQEHLSEIYESIEELKDIPGLEAVWDHMSQYYDRGGKIQKIEAVTQFLTLVADGKIDTTSISEKAITKIIDLINKIFEALGIEKRISTASDIKRFSDSIVQAFQGQNTDALKATLGDRFAGGTSLETLDQLSGQDQEDAIKALIKKTPASVSDAKLNELIVKATGITQAEAQALIDEVRKPVVPPKPVLPISMLSDQSKQVSINKFRKVREKPQNNEPGWWKRQWESIKNGSAYIDNPYRFITKITEDINREYGLRNNEKIPLGRQFEKTAAGSAALKVDSFINDIIRGKIGGENLGRLKGENYNDFLDYLAARRVIDRLKKQEEKLRDGEAANRQTGNITRQDAEVMLEYLKQKHGKLDDFKKRADAFQTHMDDMLKNLVASGILSQESYDQIKADNDFYAPFSVVQSKLVANQEKQSVGISGIVKRIKGIDYKLPTTVGEALTMINSLGDALNEGIISPEEYFNTSLEILEDAKNSGLISTEEYDNHIASLENPGFAINDILDAAANMIYKSEGLALKNRMLNRLYAYKAFDSKGLFIQNVEGHKAVTLPDGTVRMTPKPLDTIKVEPGMAPIKLRVNGKDVIVAVNEKAAAKLNEMNNYETATILKVADVVNKLFRLAVITASPGFQVVNFAIDFTRTVMLSRYGPIAGKGLIEPMVNAALFMPQYIEALLHSAAGNLGFKTKTYKQWMESNSFSKGMFDNLFNNDKKIKEVDAPLATRMLKNLVKLTWLDVPGSILEQTHKLATHQRGMSVEGLKPEMVTSMLSSIINKSINPSMTQEQLKEASDRLNYEVQNFAGSPNFPQTHRWMKMASLFLQFFSARVKGEVTDYRRIANLFTTKGEGVKLTAQERAQMILQFMSIAGAIAAYAIRNNADDKDEDEFDGNPPYHKDNYLHIPLGYFEYVNDKNESQQLRDYAKIPLRGLTATMNVMANSFVKFYKRQNPDEFKKMAMAFGGNASPVNLNGGDARELGESLASNLTPVFKFFIEYSFNRDTHNHRDLVPDFVTGKGMLSKYRHGQIKPWDVKTKKTPQWAKDMSKFIYENLGISISAIELDHMENTMGNPTELYDNAVKKRLFRSEMKYPLYGSPASKKNESSATVTPIKE